MHTEAQLRRAAQHAGCRVLEIRRLDSPVGPVVVGRFEGPSNEAAYRLLLEFAADDVADPLARTIGLDVAHRYGYFDQAHFIHDFREFSGVSPSVYLKYRASRNHIAVHD